MVSFVNPLPAVIIAIFSRERAEGILSLDEQEVTTLCKEASEKYPSEEKGTERHNRPDS